MDESLELKWPPAERHNRTRVTVELCTLEHETRRAASSLIHWRVPASYKILLGFVGLVLVGLPLRLSGGMVRHAGVPLRPRDDDGVSALPAVFVEP